MLYPRLVSFSILSFAVSLTLTGCGSYQTGSMTSSTPGTGVAPTVAAVGVQTDGVAPNREQEVQFNEAMNPATINGQSFQVADSTGKLAPGTVSYDPDFNTASFLPNPALQPGTNYTATITTAVTGANGTHLGAPYSYTFTTRSDADTSPLMVNSATPAANATCVSASTGITITFDEAPDASTVTSANFTVTGPSGAIGMKISISVATTQVVLTPTSPLPSGTITVTVSNVADLAGVKMAAPYTWSFSTACGGGASASTYLYTEVPSVAIRGYKADVDKATLTEVPGSPFAEASSGPGALIVNNDFVYSTTTDLTTVGGAPFPSGTVTLWVYRADAASGTLAKVQSFPMPIGGGLYLDPTGHDFYEISGSELLMLAINSDGTVTDTGSSITLPGPVGSVAVSPNGKRMFATVTTGTAPDCMKGPCPTSDVIWEIDRDPATGTLTLNHQVSGTSNLHLTNLRFDASGNFLLGLADSLKQITVESVNYSTGDLTPVPGSPFASTVAQTGEFTRAFEIDPSGTFVYAVNLGETQFNTKYVLVFSISRTTGTLTRIQTFEMTPGADTTGLVVDQSLVFVVNWYSVGSDVPSVPSSINVLKRDPNTGILSPGGSPIVMQDREGLQGAAVMHFQ
jgi:hypothetical protein